MAQKRERATRRVGDIAQDWVDKTFDKGSSAFVVFTHDFIPFVENKLYISLTYNLALRQRFAYNENIVNIIVISS